MHEKKKYLEPRMRVKSIRFDDIIVTSESPVDELIEDNSGWGDILSEDAGEQPEIG